MFIRLLLFSLFACLFIYFFIYFGDRQMITKKINNTRQARTLAVGATVKSVDLLAHRNLHTQIHQLK